jgi:hypothetical protein
MRFGVCVCVCYRANFLAGTLWSRFVFFSFLSFITIFITILSSLKFPHIFILYSFIYYSILHLLVSVSSIKCILILICIRCTRMVWYTTSLYIYFLLYKTSLCILLKENQSEMICFSIMYRWKSNKKTKIFSNSKEYMTSCCFSFEDWSINFTLFLKVKFLPSIS